MSANANPPSPENFRLAQDVELPALRPLDEFMLGQARFAVPPLHPP